MPADPLDLLGDLPDWPGSRPPKNRSKKQPVALDSLNGARSKMYRINGTDIEMFTIGEAARALGRSASTLRMWENQGWIPRATYRSPAPRKSQLPNKVPKGRRLYSRNQVEFLKDCILRFNLDDKNSKEWEKFKVYAITHWPK